MVYYYYIPYLHISRYVIPVIAAAYEFFLLAACSSEMLFQILAVGSVHESGAGMFYIFAA